MYECCSAQLNVHYKLHNHFGKSLSDHETLLNTNKNCIQLTTDNKHNHITINILVQTPNQK